MQGLNKHMLPLLVASVFVACLIAISPLAIGQTTSATTGTAVRVTCPVSGSSTEVKPLNFRRRAITLQNKAGKQIRVGFITGTSTPLLDTTNSFTLEASSNYIDSAPGVFTGRIMCMSTDASTAALDVTETSQ